MLPPDGLPSYLDQPPFLFTLVFCLVGNYFMTFPFYVIFHIFLKLPSLKLPAEVTVVGKDKEPPTAQDAFEIFLLSKISKSQERNPRKLFTNVSITLLQFPYGSALRTTLFVLAVSISLHCQMLLFPELCVAQVLDYVLFRCQIPLSYDITPNF